MKEFFKYTNNLTNKWLVFFMILQLAFIGISIKYAILGQYIPIIFFTGVISTHYALWISSYLKYKKRKKD